MNKRYARMEFEMAGRIFERLVVANDVSEKQSYHHLAMQASDAAEEFFTYYRDHLEYMDEEASA